MTINPWSAIGRYYCSTLVLELELQYGDNWPCDQTLVMAQIWTQILLFSYLLFPWWDISSIEPAIHSSLSILHVELLNIIFQSGQKIWTHLKWKQIFFVSVNFSDASHMFPVFVWQFSQVTGQKLDVFMAEHCSHLQVVFSLRLLKQKPNTKTNIKN